MDTTMYLSRFLIPRQIALKRRLFSEYDLHRALWTCFPGLPAGMVRPFLFRTSELAAGTRILMLSKDRPLPLDFAEWEGTKAFQAEFAPGSLFLFRLRANPVKRVTSDNRLRAITDRSAPDSGGPSPLRGWLEGKARLHGFELKSVPEFSACHLAVFSKNSGSGSISLNVVDIGGALQVTDADRFADAFRNGIGHGRAFGCGMLLLRRIAL